MISTPDVDALVHAAIHRVPLVSVCAWCPNPRERTLDAMIAGNEVTHGICPSCVAKMDDVTDDSGRSVAPAQAVLAERPTGPWSGNGVKS